MVESLRSGASSDHRGSRSSSRWGRAAGRRRLCAPCNLGPGSTHALRARRSSRRPEARPVHGGVGKPRGRCGGAAGTRLGDTRWAAAARAAIVPEDPHGPSLPTSGRHRPDGCAVRRSRPGRTTRPIGLGGTGVRDRGRAAPTRQAGQGRTRPAEAVGRRQLPPGPVPDRVLRVAHEEGRQSPAAQVPPQGHGSDDQGHGPGPDQGRGRDDEAPDLVPLRGHRTIAERSEDHGVPGRRGG